jgi:hypothetical protein
MVISIKNLHRKKSFWAVVGVFLVYTVFGFFIAPSIVHRQIVNGIATNLHRDATLKKVRVNPLNLSVTLRGFALKDPDGTAFVTFDEFYLNFQLSSLVRWAYTFKEVRLDNPNTHVRLMPDGRPNFADLTQKTAGQPAPEAVAGKKKPLIPRLVIGDLQINGARFRATNLTVAEPEEIAFTPVGFRLFDFTTIPNRNGEYTLAATGPGGGRWSWTGSLMFEPMHSSGTFVLDDTQLQPVWDVIRNRVNFEITRGVLGLRLDYAVDVRADSVLASVTGASVTLDDLAVREKGKEPDLFTLDSLRVTGMRATYPASEVSVTRVALSGARAVAWLSEDSLINWQSLVPPAAKRSGVATAGPAPDPLAAAASSGPAPEDAPEDASRPAPGNGSRASQAKPWTARVGEIALERCSVHFEDRTTTPDFAIDLSPIDITLRHVTSQPDSVFDLTADVTIAEKGRLRIDGTVAALPPGADLAIDLSGFPLPIVQPYLNPVAKLELVGGSASVIGKTSFQGVEEGKKPEVLFEGRVASRDFVTRDTIKHDRFVAWKSLDVSGIRYDSKRIDIAEIKATVPYAKIFVHEDRTTNIHDVLAPSLPAPGDTSAAGDDKPAAKAGASMPIRIGVVNIVDGTADFADFSLILPFAVGIESLNGAVSDLSSEELSRADVTLDGRFLPNGVVQVRGKVNPLSGDLYTNLDVIFKDFDMPALTPYAGQYIGREIDKGKLTLTLNYQVAQRRLVGKNKVFLDQFELGKDIESPDATSLPVGFAIALLKNRNGEIDLDIPVEGNLDDPKFSIWDAVKDILINIITKAVTAPFALLGNLVGIGGDSDELSYIDYAAGSSELSSDEREKVTKLAGALNERPQLSLEIRGRVQPDADAAALREAKFAAIARERAAADPKRYAPPQGVELSPRLLRDLFVERFGKDGVKALEQKCQVPEIGKDGKPKDDTVLDEAAFYAQIRKILVDGQVVEESELRMLGMNRSLTIKNELVINGQIPDSRVFLLDVENAAELKDGLIRLDLTLTD